MIRLLLVASCLLLAYAQPIQFEETDSLWQSFKATHKRTYTGELEALRKEIFKANVEKIFKHNAEADLGMHSYWLGINKFTDLTNAEFREMNKLKPRLNVTKGSSFMAPLNAPLPPKVDWRRKGYVTPVKDQGQCGSCWAFSATGSLEGQHFRKTGNLVSLSEQNLVDCSEKQGNEGCNGGLMDDAYDYVKENHGLDTEACYPYTAEDGQCKFKTACIGATVTGFMDVTPHGNEDALKAAVATQGPISIAIDASQSSFQSYSHGIYDEPACSSDQLDHGVLAVGYGSKVHGGRDYWIVKNSWGDSWGMNGYIHMSRNKDNQCGVATMASYPLV